LSKHPGFVPVLELRWLEEFVMLVLPYMDAGDLLSLVRQSGPLDIQMTLDILHDILDALDFAHSIDIALVDITIENVLLANSPASSLKAKLGDYDQCVFVDPEFPLVPWSGLITRRTRPPELYRRADYDPRKLDIFGAGVIAALMTSSPKNHAKIITTLGHLTPLNNKDPLGNLIAVPAVLRSLINSLIAYDPGHRPGAADALLRLKEVKICLEKRSSAHDAKIVENFFENFGNSANALADLIKQADLIETKISDVNVSCG
jgi:serine/threonine protein kinase